LALAATQRELSAARKRHARALAAETSASPWRQRVALTIYVLSGHTTQAPAVFLEGPRARRWPRGRRAADEVWRERIEDWFLAASADDINALGDPAAPGHCRALRRARLFHAEHALALFVIGRNEDGCAPSTTALLKELRCIWGRQDRRVGQGGTLPRSWQHRQAFAVWASRWRKRWGGIVGVLRVRDHIPVEVRQEKAGVGRFVFRGADGQLR
jgi:hypothetical protein